MARVILFSIFFAALLPAYSANGGTFGDGLVRCMVSHTTEEDQETLVRWIVVAFAENEAVDGIVAVERNYIPQIQIEMAQYVERLFLNDCLLEAREAARYEGEAAVIEAFAVVSRIAGQQAMNDPGSLAVIDGYIQYLDEARFEREIFGR